MRAVSYTLASKVVAAIRRSGHRRTATANREKIGVDKIRADGYTAD